MSSTRRSKEGAPLSQYRYASAPEYAEMRGISAGAALDKTRLASVCIRERHLIFFLQSRSVELGADGVEFGAAGIVEEMLELIPEEFGTREMRENPEPANGIYPVEIATKIRAALERESGIQLAGGTPGLEPEVFCNPEEEGEAVLVEDLRTPRSFSEWHSAPAPEPVPEARVSALRDSCIARARAELPRLIKELCIRPPLAVLPGLRSKRDHLQSGSEICSVPYLRDLGSALERYRTRYNDKARASVVETSIQKAVFPPLEYAFETKKIVLIEGGSGLGKTASVRAWCEMNRHCARYVSLPGICNKSTFTRLLARTLGISNATGHSVSKVIPRIHEFLEGSRLMLVIDEAQHLFPATSRPERAPELVEWVRTCCRSGVALITTAEWDRRLVNTEKSTTWDSEQFRRRVVRYTRLPLAPVDQDFIALAAAHLPGVGPAAWKALAGYGVTMGRSLTRMVDSIEDIKRAVAKDGRVAVTAADIRAAFDGRSASDAAMCQTPRTAGAPRRRGGLAPDGEAGAPEPAGQDESAAIGPAAERLQAHCTPAAPRPQDGSFSDSPMTDRGRIRSVLPVMDTAQ
jgi:hypothetical protein